MNTKPSFKLLKRRFAKLARRVPTRSINTVWLTVCLIFTAFAVFNFSQINLLNKDIARFHQNERTTNKLLIASISLRHLDLSEESSSNAIRLRLNTSGFSSFPSLFDSLEFHLNQLDTTGDDQVILFKLQLQNQLSALENTLSTQIRDQKPNTEMSTQLESWYTEVSDLLNYLNTQTYEQKKHINELQKSNLIVTLFGLAFSIFLAFVSVWKRSEQNKRFETEMSFLSDQARTDPLTGVLNRRGWLEQTGKHLRRCAREGSRSGSLAILDIDYFKQYNDTFGHEAGDERLRHFATILRQNFRPGDLIARVGGEEFAIMLMNCPVEDSKRIVDRIRESDICDVPFSAGLTNIEDHETIIKAMAAADQALYQAKNSGRNCSKIVMPN